MVICPYVYFEIPNKVDLEQFKRMVKEAANAPESLDHSDEDLLEKLK